MKTNLTLLFLLSQICPLFGQIRKNTFHAIPEGPNNLLLSVGSYYPVRDALDYLNHEYGWRISYEDPVYPDAELSDIAIPNWKNTHPGERGFYVPKFTEMQFRILKPTGSQGEEKKILTGLVEQLNRSGRPVKFKVLDASGGRQVIVGTLDGVGALDHAVLRPEPKSRNGSEELHSLTQKCSTQMPSPMVVGTVSANMLEHITVPPRRSNVSCREALLALTAEEGTDVVYQMLEDANGKSLVVNIVLNRVATESPK
ncbi:hypothetical protein P8936_15175 [Edaphobacter paludis]|uniref:Uncharacterized protein n=1 Tax=Edaphobacter paludis TaxID=3035702 RepID=A0AAU7D5Q6_9BACT